MLAYLGNAYFLPVSTPFGDSLEDGPKTARIRLRPPSFSRKSPFLGARRRLSERALNP